MSARANSCPLQVLRSPKLRPSELQVVDFGLEAASAPLATPAVPRNIYSFTLPPSPPYTNPHLRRAIPLPFFDEIAYKDQSNLMENEKDADRCMLLDVREQANLLSPPYSPGRRSLSLPTVDEEREDEPATPLSTGILSAGADEHKWGQFIDEADESEPPLLKLKDLDLGEEPGDWDEPLFLDAPLALRSSGSLSLSLFAGAYSSDDEGPPCRPPVAPPTPIIRSSSLPNIDSDAHEKSKPLFDPSHFNVFENGWDTITTDSSHWEQDVLSNSDQDQSSSFYSSAEPSPSSPSRRSIIDLPIDEQLGSVTPEPLARSRPLSFDEDDDFTNQDDRISERSLKHLPFLFPTEVVQTPFNVPLLLPSSILRTPPADSLLFAARDPQDIPLPDSPQSPVLSLHGDYVIPPLMLEECRIRKLHEELLKEEAEAKTREVLLTEYIARLNAMQPPSLPVPVLIYTSERQGEIGSVTANSNACSDSNSSHPEEQPFTLNLSLSSTEASFSSNASVTMEFFQARRREVQNAVAMRATERRRRKLLKERIRELDSLLHLKTGRFRTVDPGTLSATRGRRRRDDEVFVLAASRSDQHLAHTNAIFPGEACSYNGPQKECQGIMQLVAKMVFRRRDTSRPLSGKTLPEVREYVRSTLSQSIYVDEVDDDNVSYDSANAQVS